MDVTSYLLGKQAGGGQTINNQNKDITITENGSTSVSADAGYTGLGTVGITTNVQPNLESKSITITENGTTTVNPTTGKDGLSQVSVTTNVEAQPDLETKSVTITENGTTIITPTTGKDGMSEVEVTTNVSGGGASEYFQTVLSYDPSDSRGGLALLIKKLPNTITIANSVTSLNYFLANCIYIEETPTMNTQNIKSMQGTFSNCWALTTINPIDTSNVTNFRDFASGCSELKNLPFLKLDKATNLNSMFENTLSVNKFSDTSIDNLLLSLISATSYTGSKKISILDYNVTSADYGFGARVKVSQYYQDFLNAGWTIN